MEVDERVSEESLARKRRTEALLDVQGIPLATDLPAITPPGEALSRSKEAVAYRTLVLLFVALKGEGLDQTIVESLVEGYGLAPHFTPNEKSFMANPAPAQQDRVDAAWRYEAAWTLLWALGYVEQLAAPDMICDVPHAVTLLKAHTAEQFIAQARLRPVAEILEQADLAYRYQGAVADAKANGTALPAGLDPGVVYERYHALNWLAGDLEQLWDTASQGR